MTRGNCRVHKNIKPVWIGMLLSNLSLGGCHSDRLVITGDRSTSAAEDDEGAGQENPACPSIHNIIMDNENPLGKRSEVFNSRLC